MHRSSTGSLLDRRRILVVDDDETARGDICDVLRASRYEVAEAWSVVQAMRLVLSFEPHAVVLDLILPDGHGVETGRAMRALPTTRPMCIVAVTMSPSSVSLVDPGAFGARVILLKPVAAELLLAEVGECFDAIPTRPIPTRGRRAARPE